MFLFYLGFAYIFLSYITRRRYNAWWGLLLILIVMGFQSGVPGDYDTYRSLFKSASVSHPDMSLFRDMPGWVGFTHLFSIIGDFPAFVFLISLIEYLILSRTVNFYCDRKYRYLAGLIFYFSLNLMVFQMKGLRQGMAIELGLLAFYCMDRNINKGTIAAAVISVIAVSLHKSYLLFIPFLALFFVYRHHLGSKKHKRRMMSVGGEIIKNNGKKKHRSEYVFPLLMAGVYVCTVVLKVLFIQYAQPLLMSLSLGGYEGYFGEMEAVSQHFLITFYGAISTFLVTWYAGSARGTRRFVAIMALLGLLAESLFFGQGNMFRFALYLYIFIIFAIPNATTFLSDKGFRKTAFFYMLLTVAYFWRTFVTVTIRHSVDGYDNYSLIFLQ